MKSIYALIAAGLGAARIAFSKSKIEKKAVSAAAAAVSESKKAVSAVVAAVVGIGLFLAPMEKAQANHGQSGIPVVTELCIISNAASDYELSRGYLVCLPSFDLSSLLASGQEWLDGSGLAAVQVGTSTVNGGGGSGYFLFRPRDRDDDNKVIYDGRWLMVTFYVSVSRNSRATISAWVTDSDGNWYSIDAWVSYDGWRGW